MRVSIFFAWYDFWIGLFYDQRKRILYFCPLPMIVIKFEWSQEMENDIVKAKCKCHACDKEFEVDFIIEPTEEEKLGFYCNECVKEHKEE